MKRIYLICPVRRCTAEERLFMDRYVADMEQRGHQVHYPHRDVDQTNDDGGVRICQKHRQVMFHCDEVHVYWTGSPGCHFDLGMAYMLSLQRAALGRPSIRFVCLNPEEAGAIKEKSFQNVLDRLCRAGTEFDHRDSVQERTLGTEPSEKQP